MKYKRIIILILILSVFLIPTCYAILKTDIIVGGSAKITGKWDVKIKDITLTSICDGCTATDPKFSSTRSSFDVSLVKPGDSVTYEITIENTGNIDAVFDTIDIKTEGNPEDQVLQITTSPATPVLAANSTWLIYLTIHYDENATNLPDVSTINFTCDIRYIQKIDKP